MRAGVLITCCGFLGAGCAAGVPAQPRTPAPAVVSAAPVRPAGRPAASHPQPVARDRGFSLERVAGEAVLRAPDGARLKLVRTDPPAPSSVAVERGYRVEMPLSDHYNREPVVKVTRQGQPVGSIPLGPLRDRWLKDDALWGGHESANQARYLNSRGGVVPFFTDARPLGSSAWALLRLYNAGASSHAQNIVLERVVRIDLRPQPTLKVLRTLRRDNDPGVAMDPAVRVLRAGSRWLLHDPPELLTLDARGMPAGRVATIPVNLRVQELLGGRWVVLFRRGYEPPHQLFTLDLAGSERRPRLLPGPWERAESFRIGASDRERLALLTYDSSSERSRCYVVSLRDRSVRPLDGVTNCQEVHLWDRRVVVEEAPTLVPDQEGQRQQIHVFEARTGRKLARLLRD